MICGVFVFCLILFISDVHCEIEKENDELLYDCLNCDQNMYDRVEPKRWNIYCATTFNETDSLFVEEKIDSIKQQLQSARMLVYPLFMKHLMALRNGDCYTLGEYVQYTKDHIEFLEAHGNLANSRSCHHQQDCNHMNCLSTMQNMFKKRSEYLHKILAYEKTLSGILTDDLENNKEFRDEYNSFESLEEKHKSIQTAINLLNTIQNYRLVELQYMDSVEKQFLKNANNDNTNARWI